MNHFKCLYKIPRGALLGTSNVLCSAEPGLSQFMGACGALKCMQLWQTGGAQGLCTNNLVLCPTNLKAEGKLLLLCCDPERSVISGTFYIDFCLC